MPGIGPITNQGYRMPGPDEAMPSVLDQPLQFSGSDVSDGKTIFVDSNTGTVTTTDETGDMVIDFSPKTGSKKKPDKFDANLAEFMDESDLGGIESDLYMGVEADLRSRQEWVDMFNRGIELLGLKIENATGEASSDGAISKVHHPLLLESVIRFQSNSRSEMLPAEGPVKVRDDQDTPIKGRNQEAEDFERDMNHYLTTVAKEYYPDFDRMLFNLGLGGCTFRKLYHCPLRQRPVSEAVSGKDLIVSNEATDLQNAGRVTHRVMMRHSTMKRLQLKGIYRNVALSQPIEILSTDQEKIKTVEGISPTPSLPADHRHEVWEIQVELDLKGFQHKKNGDPTGLPLPYRVTIERTSRAILEIRRDWRKGDEDMKKRRRYVKYGMVPGLGFYDYGFVHILGNTQRSLTAIERELIDAGQFANFPGFLVAKQNGAKQETTELRVAPGRGKEIETGGAPIGDVIMKLPYGEPSQALMALMNKIADDGRRLGMTAEVNVGEGRADVPVGTIVALIEQATKVMSAVHARMHTSQQEEFEILKELFAENPAALSKFAKKPARQWADAQDFADLDLVPSSNPNVPSHIHRIMQATALVQLLTQSGGLLNAREIYTRVFRILNVEDIDSLFSPPAPPQDTPPDPKLLAKQADVQQKEQDTQRQAQEAVLEGQLRMKEIQAESVDRAADRASREKVAMIKLQQESIKDHARLEHAGIAAGGVHPKTTAAPSPTPAPVYQGTHQPD